MNHIDMLAEHLAPLAAPLPAPSTLSTRRPRIDAEAIEAMAAARVTPFPERRVVHVQTPGLRPFIGHVVDLQAARAETIAEAWRFAVPPRILRPWWTRVNWGFAAVLATLFCTGAAIGTLIGDLVWSLAK